MEDYSPQECRGYLMTLQSTLLAECQQVTERSEFSRANIMDVGCSYGATTAQISEYWPHNREVLGIDSNKNAINYAFTFVADENMDFTYANIEDQSTFDLTWAAKFDWIFSSQALFFVRDHGAALRNLMWCMRPGGKCFIAVPAAKPADFHVAARKVLAADCWKQAFEPISDLVSDMTENNCNRLWFHHPHADRVYSALLEQVGYQILHTKLFDFRYIFSSGDEYKACLRSLIRKPLQYVPTEKSESFLKEFQKTAMKKAKKTPGGSVIWNLKYVLVLAKRPEQ
ncbi:juvenile hormone acid O-methyltransferase [Parasteatoda tepidariorum]|uniref:Trans-aconitate 2-methyltransferase n=1 Tax=Parasteatoda tepidariorum TaxID=114398 RepID=A0A2L2YJ68_PARTP|nr:trans-aconitate 2-methyltransferase [Parasteatoda tepidariorum]